MKWITITIFLLLPFFSFSQDDNSHKNGIGLHLAYDGNNGLIGGVRYSRQTGNGGIAKFEFNSNGNGVYFGRVGYEFLQLRFGNLEFGTGLNLKYTHRNLAKIGFTPYKELALEVPLEIRFHLSSEFSLYSGLSFSQLLSKRGKNRGSLHNTVSEIRLGVGYRF